MLAIRRPMLCSARFCSHSTFCSTSYGTRRPILRAIAIPSSQTAVKACHSSSKTFTAAEATLWFLARFDHAIVITMASKFEQVVDELWCEIRKAIRTSRIRYPEPNQTKHCPRLVTAATIESNLAGKPPAR